MDLVSILRTLGGLGTVLGILSGALWLVRRYDIRLPGRTGMLRVSRLELIERLPLDARRSVALLRRDGREHLILIAPEGHLILESGVVRDAADAVAEEAASDAVPREIPQFRAELVAAGESFGTLVEQARERAIPFGRALSSLIGRALAFAASARARWKGPPVAVGTVLHRPSTRELFEDARERATSLGRALGGLIDRATAFAVPPTVAMSAPAIFHDPPISLRTSLKRKPNRKAVRKAQAARKGLRHA